MKNRPSPEKNAALRSLPSVDECFQTLAGTKLSARLGKRRFTDIIRQAIADTRRSILAGETIADASHAVEARVLSLAEASLARGLRKVLNATGVILHTNLGRAPLSEEALEAIENAAAYCTLEYDLNTGGRGVRAPLAEKLLADLTGAEDAVVVNNCAAAAYLVLKTFAAGRDVIVSRGELVEIGGDFRVPEILAESGAAMREVGTTNRTSLEDYDAVLGPSAAMILRVHPSNYRVVGFTEQAALPELVELAEKNNIILFEDIGSGVLIELSNFGVKDEPTVRDSVAAGAHLVAFSGDKLLGGPQAGVIVGKEGLIARLRRDPLYRALRPDKLISAALEATLLAYARETAEGELPVIRMLAETAASIRERAAMVVEATAEAFEEAGFRVELRDGFSTTGGGTAPLAKLETCLIAITHPEISADTIAARLRLGTTPVIARIEENTVCIDLRTIENAGELIAALLAFASN
ncbi:MAG: L-seryl-tRNA(Sec) selenium transferase [Acidobacteria bacterium OLB17]|nr:MAG: L-seryl-tRNA(Sec) selenium transferase [Acidobacteria bacterium OLB17]MCZ2390940.1 L-seryl-tRNA(Sec) selenium transferase [Acidobacteriota bacterium]